MKRLLLIMAFLMGTWLAGAQEQDTSGAVMGYIQDGDTIIFKNIKEIPVFPDREFKNNRQYRRYTRYIQKVKRYIRWLLKRGSC
nr:hypothetical protein [Draconibacterium orientale]